ncbi:hypothetical protein [Streptomyces acidiscabies]|uniref:Uncharacterized protein n=1 Tax=Streptomyces acidiscabies TaxID=42234 RepID=A0AAP6EHZ8_9ACTN|nr:hypothetical protein [Streptomyces acidiscabies]MBP5942080.1 hypothetical protein [Streptomyces sp. LBUM 1476]MBZ3913571.1 hypothetical protein [Streptomyces acidiscabies]MDX2963409.1 hypothetical protein [Streptomyces acidiscabies]MDX3023143.1 hypothetical protein [Streptomyces acidiscabies]MDX3792713.1 hypothetical protein [Streptomyces acidiscabies]
MPVVLLQLAGNIVRPVFVSGCEAEDRWELVSVDGDPDMVNLKSVNTGECASAVRNFFLDGYPVEVRDCDSPEATVWRVAPDRDTVRFIAGYLDTLGAQYIKGRAAVIGRYGDWNDTWVLKSV